MRYTLGWDNDEQTVMRVDLRVGIGIFDYMPPLNDAGGWALMADGDVGMVMNLGWQIPFPARGFGSLHTQIIGAPHNIRPIVIVCANPLTRLVMTLLLLRPYPALQTRLHVAASLDAARTLLSQRAG